ncbi:MAG: hypothetical protein LBH43_21860 [Treponema sp.]|jgi:hypothetical protein|nr:hypothetical protein [Treponema sp.]
MKKSRGLMVVLILVLITAMPLSASGNNPFENTVWATKSDGDDVAIVFGKTEVWIFLGIIIKGTYKVSGDKIEIFDDEGNLLDEISIRRNSFVLKDGTPVTKVILQ